MPLLNTADAVYLGAQPVDAVYLGADRVWGSLGGAWTPDALTGLTVWIEADQLGLADGADVTVWPNLGSGGDGLVVGDAAPKLRTDALNGLPVVRFKPTEGRVRGTGMVVDGTFDVSVFVLCRMVGPTVGRIFTNTYPPYNYLVGTHTSRDEWLYDNGIATDGIAWALPTPWKLYENVSSNVPRESRLFVNGTDRGMTGSSAGHDNRWNLSGYAATEETCDCEVAALICYDRALSPAERVQVETYLHDKWIEPPLDPDTVAYLEATGLDAAYAPALDALVVGLKTTGLWAKMQAVYPFVGGTAALHRWNLKDPRDADAAYRLTFIGGTGGIHSEALGYRPNAQGAVSNGGYADTHLVPLGTLGQNSTHLAYYSLADVPVTSRCEIGCYNWAGSGARFHIIARYQPSEFYYGMSEDGFSNAAVPASSGLFVATRTAADRQTAYRNGLAVGTSSPPSIPLPPVPVWVGGINEFVDRSDLPYGFASIGAGLTAPQVADLYMVVQDFQAALGREVSP